MNNLQDNDVDLLNLMNDVSTHERLWRPLIHVFDLDWYSDDRTVKIFIDRIMFWIIQDIQTYINRNLYDLLKRNLEEENKMSIQGKCSFLNVDGDELARASYAIKNISTISQTHERINKSDKEFIDKMLVNINEEKNQLERKLKLQLKLKLV